MSDWKNCKISDVGVVVGGATPSTKVEDNYINGTIPWLTPKDLSTFNGRYISHGERNITEKGLKSCSAQLLPKNTILFSSRAPIGYIAIANNSLCTNQGFKSIIPNDNIYPLFLYYLLKYNKHVIENMGSGTTFKEVSGQTMKNIDICIPVALNTQIQIASILGKIDDKIELNQKINDNLAEQAQAIYKSWFIDYEPFGNNMPNDWYIGKLDDLAEDIICGKTPSTKKEENYGKDIPFITIPDMHNKIYVIETERYLSKLGADTQIGKYLPINSICVSCIGTAGLTCLTGVKSQTNQQINSVIPKKNISPYYVYLLTKALADTIQNLGAGGSTIYNLNKTQFSQIEVLIPANNVLAEFDEIIKPVFDLIYNNQKETINLINLRDTLLPKLMSGEIDVFNIKI